MNKNYFVNQEPYTTEIIANNVDELVLKGIQYIKHFGERISVTADNGIQAYGVTYILTNPKNRLHNLRYPESIQYLCRELIAYFRGSLFVNDGLAQASRKWINLADKNGKINSNYGFYVFHQKRYGRSQYDWVISNLTRNSQSRKALININQLNHKKISTKDFPCTIAIQFLVRNNYLCCEVLSRSEDVFLGLPYDIGFFSFLNELVFAHLNKFRESPLKLGYTLIKCSFTQIYDETALRVDRLYEKAHSNDITSFQMPTITDAEEVLEDIYKGTKQSSIIQWIYKNAKLEE